MPLVVFDLDHTLIRCDSFAGFNRQLLARAWWRIALALAASPVVAVLALSRRTLRSAGSLLVWCGTVGTEESELHALMDAHVLERFHEGGELVCRGAVAALRAHQAEGARLVIATGSVGPFAERVCARIGLAGVEVVGSELEPFLGGWVARRHCYGPEKVLMLRERGIGERWDVAYTDSATDLALLERASRRCLVNATSRAERRVQRQLGEAFESIAWQ